MTNVITEGFGKGLQEKQNERMANALAIDLAKTIQNTTYPEWRVMFAVTTALRLAYKKNPSYAEKILNALTNTYQNKPWLKKITLK